MSYGVVAPGVVVPRVVVPGVVVPGVVVLSPFDFYAFKTLFRSFIQSDQNILHAVLIYEGNATHAKGDIIPDHNSPSARTFGGLPLLHLLFELGVAVVATGETQLDGEVEDEQPARHPRTPQERVDRTVLLKDKTSQHAARTLTWEKMRSNIEKLYENTVHFKVTQHAAK